MPKVSIVIPVYNAELKLNRLLDGLLSQTFIDFEVIMVDDGSQDNSRKICEDYSKKDSRFKIFSIANGGVSNARNFGIEKATGEYVSFIDSDDYVDKDYLQILYSRVKEKNADFCMCNFYLHNGRENKEQLHGFLDNYYIEGKEFKQVLYKHIVDCDTVGYFSVWNKLFSRKIIVDNDIMFNKSMSFGEDMLFIMEVIRLSNSAVFTDKCLYYYEQLDDGQYKRYRRSVLDSFLKCYDVIIKNVNGYAEHDINRIKLSKKYYWYICRQAEGICKNERKKNKLIKSMLKKDTTVNICKVLVNSTIEEKQKYNIKDYELKVPNLVVKKKFIIATIRLRYIVDKTYFLRKLLKR